MSATGRRGRGSDAATDVSSLAARLGASPPAGVATLDQQTVDDLVALIDRERRRRTQELAGGFGAAAKKLPWPARKVADKALGR